MATQRNAPRSRPAAKKTARPASAHSSAHHPTHNPAHHPAHKAKASKGAVPKPKAAAARPVAKTATKPLVKAVPAKAPVATGKGKGAPRPPAVVRPLGVLPPESISKATHKPARPLPLPKPVRPVPKNRKDDGVDGTGRGVTAADFREFEQRLLEERGRVLKEMGHYEATVLKVNPRDSAGDLSGYSFHMADVGTDAMEREKAFQLASAEGRILLEINEALRRMARGEYGVCESCENPISRARLEAMPTARLCLPCKEKEERVARGNA
ncbi:MAG: hypothetical protein E6K81_07520 [Candidatus Eisenbacteria bacterium]|uniref:Zinc finger DksA/TraR C4-type domain-containing protein n=1 Tax=Eiseniibacteriota bacterium TaxID=2212470 RepID=A0A538U9J3_UNCEI|nr:MAG: hypothetical protein E6K81_07520 [Candidatus Eisenbacteria bacterium]